MKAKILDISKFIDFLGYVNKFVQSAELELTDNGVKAYCRNPLLPTIRMMFESNVIKMSDVGMTNALCVRNVIAFRSALETLLKLNKDLHEIEIDLEESGYAGEISAICFGDEESGGFRLATIDREVIKNNVDNPLKTELSKDWKFNILPERLDIAQNKTNTIVNMNEAGCYLKQGKDKAVLVVLTSRKSKNANNVSIPIADSSVGNLINEICIHDSAFRLMNVLRVQEPEKLSAFFDYQHKVFVVDSELVDGSLFVKSRMVSGLVAGK